MQSVFKYLYNLDLKIKNMLDFMQAVSIPTKFMTTLLKILFK